MQGAGCRTPRAQPRKNGRNIPDIRAIFGHPKGRRAHLISTMIISPLALRPIRSARRLLRNDDLGLHHDLVTQEQARHATRNRGRPEKDSKDVEAESIIGA
jgi:hypothetical protein